MPVILITDSSGNLSKYKLAPSEAPYTLGRAEDCHIALPDEIHLSRVHCLLTASENGVELRDNNSSNGVFDADRRISCELMEPGKEYSLGNCVLCLRPEISAAAPQTSAPQAAPLQPPSPQASAPTQRRSAPLRPRRRAVLHHSHLTSTPGSELGLPTEFGLELRLLSPAPPLTEGAELRFGVKADCAAYVYLVQYDSSGTATLMVPGCAGDDVRLFANTEMQFPRAVNNEYMLVIEPPFGAEVVIALACTARLPFDKLWLSKLPEPNSALTPGELEQNIISTLQGSKNRWSSAVLHLQTEPAPTGPNRPRHRTVIVKK